MTSRRSRRQTMVQPSAPVVDANAANAFSGYLFAGAMALISVLIPWYFELPLNFDVTDREFNRLVFIPVVFALIGLYSLLKAIRDTLRVRKFGTTTLVAGTAKPGQIFEGVLRSSRNLAPDGDYTVLLRCIRTYRVGGPNPHATAADKAIYKDELRWEGKQVVPRSSVQSSAGIRFVFSIPADALPSHGPPVYERVDGNVRWILTVTAPMPGLDYYAAFAVDVK